MRAEGWRTQDGRQRVLSERQREVLALLARGHTNAEIGEVLGITLDGAKWHVSEIISKLGVANREEAAALWRRERRTPRILRAVAESGALRWLMAGTGAVAGVAVAAAVVMAAMRGDDGPLPSAPETPSVESATPTVATSPTPVPLTAEEILHRSEQAMAAIPIIRVETVLWPSRMPGENYGVAVLEYSGTSARILAGDGYEATHCLAAELTAPAFASRSLGAYAIYPEPPNRDEGVGWPVAFELIGEETVDGEDVWVIRYAYEYPSDHPGTIPIEDTEWISKADYRLLRIESEQRDDYGFQGQVVSVLWPVEVPATDCPVAPRFTPEELAPLTVPRLTAN